MSLDKTRKVPGSPAEWMNHAQSDLRLAQLAAVDASIRSEQGFQTPYAVEARYPGSWMDITASDVQEAIETAKRTLQWAKGLIFRDKKENT
jgi:hypothetical protein